MKNIVLLYLLYALFAWPNPIAAQRCHTTEYEIRQIQLRPEIQTRKQNLEKFLLKWHESRGNGAEVMPDDPITIPVVVHIVYNTAAENIDDAQIFSQIEVLNRDFNGKNLDVDEVPLPFAGLVADMGIQFVLASIDPFGDCTDGITRTSTSETIFDDDDQVKFTATGGQDIWDPAQYLNIWVCDLDGFLGYAAFPWDGDDEVDGVVIDYEAFGTVGTADPPYDQGRTATHEVGHWMGLYHIWGDDGNSCLGTDLVADTPNQGNENFGCPAFPAVSCGNGPNGDLFMNYMDYTDDACLFMFTNGQHDRISGFFNVEPREDLYFSDGYDAEICCPVFNCVALDISGETADFPASQRLVAFNTISNNSDVMYTAGDLIILQPGFRVTAGSDFIARIGDCEGAFRPGTVVDRTSVREGGNQTAPESPPGINISPNPFSTTTTITYTLAESQPVSLQILDATGRPVAQPVQLEMQEAGEYRYSFEAQGLPDGVYFVVWRKDGEQLSKRVVKVNR